MSGYVYVVRAGSVGSFGEPGASRAWGHGPRAAMGRAKGRANMHCCRANVMIITFARNIRTTTQHRRAAADGQHAARAAPPPTHHPRHYGKKYEMGIRARRNVSATVHLPLQQHPPHVPRPVLSTSSLRSGFLTRLLGLAFGTRLCETLRPRPFTFVF